MTTAKEGLTSSLSLSFTYEDIVDLEYAIDLAYLEGHEGNPEGFMDAYQGHVGFMIHRNVEKILRKMLDGDGRPLWTPSIRDGAPNMIAGWPYFLNNHMDDIAANKHPILFGNFAHFAIRMVNDLQIFRFWDSNTVTAYSYEFIGFCRDDSNTRGPLNHATRNAADGTVCEAYQKMKIKA